MSSSSAVSSPSPSTQSKVPSDARVSLVGIVLGIVGVLVVAVIIFMTLRFKRRRSTGSANSLDSPASPPRIKVIDHSHPAAHITPFGAPGGETPRFNHVPGSDMRIAFRRSDGAWHFADPQTPFTPLGVSEIDVHPSPSSSTIMLPPGIRKKEHESKASREIRLGYDRDYDIEANPPPAYGHGYGGYINHAKH